MAKPSKRGKRKPVEEEYEYEDEEDDDEYEYEDDADGESTTVRRLVRESIAVVLFAAGLFLLLSLIAGRTVCGPTGAALKNFFAYAMGLPAAYLFVAGLFTLGIMHLRNHVIPLHRPTLAGIAGSLLCLGTFIAIPETDLARDVTDRAVMRGGFFGAYVARFLVAYFHTFGAVLITMTLTIVALIFATNRVILDWARMAVVRVVDFVTAPAPPLGGLEEGYEDDGEYEDGEDEEDDEYEYEYVDDDEEYEDEEEEEEEEEAPPPPPKPSRKKRTVKRPKKAAAAVVEDEEEEEAEPAVAKKSKRTAKKAAATAAANGKAADDEEDNARGEPIAIPEPVIRSDQAAKNPAKDAPIKPPMLRQFVGLPADSQYVFPSTDLFEPLKPVDHAKEEAAIRRRAEILVKTLKDFRILCRVVEIDKGPVIAMYELELAPGTKVKTIANLSDDIAMALKSPSVRIVAPIPNKSTVGVEVPNQYREAVNVRSLVQCDAFRNTTAALPLLLGKDGQGRPLIEDLAQMPHLLVAGATGAGKSVCLNTIILSFLLTRRPEEIQLILIDPKMVELSQFRKIPHLMTPVVTDMRRAPGILDWAVQRMEDRYALLHDAGVRHIVSYNKLKPEDRAERLHENGRDPESAPPFLPYIVIIVDELADLMMTAAKEVEASVTRLAQKSRAVGIHLVVATQRPSADVLTGLIKANMPTRIAFRVSSKTDSRIIVDQNGADKLLGMGDMLYLPPRTSALRRCQGTYVSDEEIRRIVRHVTQAAKPRFDEELGGVKAMAGKKLKEVNDALYEEAVKTVLETGRGSTSLLQRKFQIGYTRAARLVDIMAEQGIVGKYKGSQAREVIISEEEWEARLAEKS